MSSSIPTPGQGDGGTPGRSRADASPDFAALSQEPDFIELRRKFRSFVFPMTVAFLAWYLLYVILSATARDFMGKQIVGVINVALVFGLLQFVSTFAIAAYYSRFAARKLDPVADRIVRTHEGGQP